MRLKSLYIKGFKSFAHETEIHFNESVTGIVGPNGSGKSNIIDAIRWVLGEQKSAELRLDKMNSVIFNGTKKRRPGQMAQVSLTFENSKNILPTEYNHVTVTRILYQSGESEYRLNQVVCRLKDITTLFMDTGIGSNSYSIIALGMVDDILNDKQNNRRSMLEQAAGVSKYKSRKQETLNKLHSAQEDLTRIDDLLFEIEGNLKTLEKQAKRTQRYFDIKTEYKTIAVDLAALKLSAFKQDYQQVEKQITGQSDRLQQSETEASQLEALLEKERLDVLNFERAMSEKQRALNQMVSEIKGRENDRQIKRQKKTFLEQTIFQLNQQIGDGKSRLQRLSEEAALLAGQTAGEKRLEAESALRLAEAKEEVESVGNHHKTLKTGLDEFIQIQRRLERDVFELEKQKAVHQNQIDHFKRENERRDKESEGRRAEMDQWNVQLVQLEIRYAEQRRLMELLEEEEQNRSVGLLQANQALQEHTEKLAEANRRFDAKKNEFKLVKSMIDNMEGVPASIRYLNADKNWQKKAPLAGDLIYVEPAYRAALENYLEPVLQYYVAEDMNEAVEGVHLLKEAQKGKAHFFLLDAFKDSDFQTPEIIMGRRALDCIQVSDLYLPLFQYLLHRVYLMDETKTIFERLPGENNGATFLSGGGGWIKRPYSFSGGSVGIFEGKKIGARKNLEILDKELLQAEEENYSYREELKEIASFIQALKNQDKKYEVQKIKDALNKGAQEKISLQTRLENFSSFILEVDEKKAGFAKQIQTFISSIHDVDMLLVEKKLEEEALRKKLTDADELSRRAADALSERSAAFNQQNIELIKLQNRIATLIQETSFRERRIADTTQEEMKKTQEVEAAARELITIDNELTALALELEKNYNRQKIKEADLNEYEQIYYRKRNDVLNAEDELRKIGKKRNDDQALASRLKDKFNEIRLQMASIEDRIQVEFNISVNEIFNREINLEINQAPQKEYNQEDLQKKADQYKKQLDGYGEINPMAVEAFKEMKERYEGVSAQKEDIVKAKTNLLDTIHEIEGAATVQFLSAFEQVRAHFIEVFKNLFDAEDAADMTLTDPAHPLESGIQIVAKPKGKRPQSIAQLSGGEKTLTATAFLFALYLYKPAPFCIFDEVDAPLDDANIEKFNRIIHKFSKESQFIIVTHNKETMASVDVIYGVHMPETGVSEVTPVDFRTFSHQPEMEVMR